MKKDNLPPIENIFRKYKKNPDYLKELFRTRPYFDLMIQIVNRRGEKGLTQSDLAKKAGMHQSSISKIESANKDIRLSTIIKIAEALDATVTIDLVPMTDFPSIEYEETGEVFAEIISENQEFTNIIVDENVKYVCE